MSEWLSSREPYTGNEGFCANCDNPIRLDRAAQRFDGMQSLPPEHDDGLPVPVYLLLCDACAVIDLEG